MIPVKGLSYSSLAEANAAIMEELMNNGRIVPSPDAVVRVRGIQSHVRDITSVCSKRAEAALIAQLVHEGRPLPVSGARPAEESCVLVFPIRPASSRCANVAPHAPSNRPR